MLDFSQIPPPNIVEALDFEGVFAELCADFRSRFPEFDALVESDPAIKLMEAFAYRETLLRARVNEAAKACMLATATDADLDNIAANFGVSRKDGESDAALRRRVLLSFEAMSTAGSRNAYVFHTLSVEGTASCSVTSPKPGIVHVHVLAYDDESAPADADAADDAVYAPLLAAVSAALNKETVRPLTDTVEVFRARRKDYAVEARLTVSGSLEFASVMDAARDSLDAYVAKKKSIGEDVPPSGIMAALSVPGVLAVELGSPQAGVSCDAAEFPHCTGTRVEGVIQSEIDKECSH